MINGQRSSACLTQSAPGPQKLQRTNPTMAGASESNTPEGTQYVVPEVCLNISRKHKTSAHSEAGTVLMREETRQQLC